MSPLSFSRPRALITLLSLAAISSAQAQTTQSKDAELAELRAQIQMLTQRLNQVETKQATAADSTQLNQRVQAVEAEVTRMQEPSALHQALDGLKASASLTTVAQRIRGLTPSSDLNTRADIEVEMPVGSIGSAEGKLFAHFRAGDGNGLAAPSFVTPNATAFNFAQPALMQAWYQLNMPIQGAGGRLSNLEFTVGKIDPFVFFDQNAYADDESEAFLNLGFVHNPLLDAGGDIGVGTYGSSPGVQMAYTYDVNATHTWKASVGFFGASTGADFNDTFGKSLQIAQLEYGGKLFNGRAGNYRLYYWNNGRAAHGFDPITFPTEEKHAGWGLSFDQQIGRHWGVFMRYGKSSTSDVVAYDRALTLGAQMQASAIGRSKDALGFAIGQVRTSEAYRLAGLGDGHERFSEVFYALRVNDNVSITPSVSRTTRGQGIDGNDFTAYNLRFKVAF